MALPQVSPINHFKMVQSEYQSVVASAKVTKNNRVYYRQYKQLIDHGFSSVHFILNSAQQIQFAKHQVEQYQLSDHFAPLLFNLTFLADT